MILKKHGRSALATALLLGAALRLRSAHACSPCSCGDPTLTVTGVERPYKNRVRVGFEERYSSRRAGDEANELHATVARSTLFASWSPTNRLTLQVVLPWITSWVQYAGRPRQLINGLGELQLLGRVLVFRERAFVPHHLLWVTAGLKFPTSPRLENDAGFPYPDDDQPGSGSWDPFAGLTYAWMSGGLVSIYASASYRHSFAGPRGYRRGSEAAFSSTVQVQPWKRVALAAGIDGNWLAADSLPNGAAVPNSGGTTLYASPALLLNPVRDLLIRASVSVPFAQLLNGRQTAGTQAAISITYDIR